MSLFFFVRMCLGIWDIFAGTVLATLFLKKLIINIHDKMKNYITTAALLAAGTAFANAALDYVWTGNAEDGVWGNQGNWAVNGNPNGYYPQSAGDNAIIGEDYAVTWSETQGYYLTTGNVSIGNNSKVTCIGGGDLNISSLTFIGSGTLEVQSEAAFGIGKAFSVDFGSMSKDSHGLLDFSKAATSAGYWGNGHTITVRGELDLTDVEGEGIIMLIDFARGSSTLNIDELTVVGSDDVEYSVRNTEEGLWVTYNAPIPEPSAFGLLASIGALALVVSRRRRK